MGTFLQDLYDHILGQATMAAISASSPGSENAEPLVWDAASSLYVPLSSVTGTGGDLDWAGATFTNAARKIFELATDSDHTLDYANGDYQWQPTGVLTNARDFTLPSNVANGKVLTVATKAVTYPITLLGASYPSGGSDPVLKYATSFITCITFRRINSVWEIESQVTA